MIKIYQVVLLAVVSLSFVCLQPDELVGQNFQQPAGLNPGDQFRLVFITAGVRDATSDQIDDYNQFVNDQANAMESIVFGLSDDWRAIVSTPTVNALENTDTDPSPAGVTGVPLYLLDAETRFADDYDEIWPRMGAYSSLPYLDIDQFGQSVGRQTPWSGTDSDGIGHEIASLGYGTVAGIGSTRFNWIENGGQLATDEYPFFGISPVFTAVPEPGGAAVCLLLTLALATRRRSRC